MDNEDVLVGDIPHTMEHLLEKAKELPRFLFRGFHDDSGGGDPRLNNEFGVIPPGFLPEAGMTANLPQDIRGLTIGDFMTSWKAHVNYTPCPSVWSSWTAHFPTAIDFALRYTCSQDRSRSRNDRALRDQPGSIAILDTHKMWPDQSVRAMRMIHMPTLVPGRMLMEYILWGPISSGAADAAYRSVRIEDIRSAAADPHWPLSSPAVDHRLSTWELDYAGRVAAPFREQPDPHRPGKVRGSKEMFMVVWAAELSRRQWKSPEPKRDDKALHKYNGYLREDRKPAEWDHEIDVIRSMAWLCKQGLVADDHRPLANTATPARYLHQQQLMMNLLHRIDNFMSSPSDSIVCLFQSIQDAGAVPEGQWTQAVENGEGVVFLWTVRYGLRWVFVDHPSVKDAPLGARQSTRRWLEITGALEPLPKIQWQLVCKDGKDIVMPLED